MQAVRPLPWDLRRPIRMVGSLAVLMTIAGVARQSTDEGGEGGCNNDRLMHVGCLGAVGGGGLIARVVAKSADNVAGAGARLIDDAAGLGADAARHGGGALARGADGAAGAIAHSDALLNSHWDEAAEVVGRMAGEEGLLKELPDLAARHPGVADLGAEQLLKYADETPGFWQEVGVELYLRDPDAWARFGGDALLEWATASSPAMRQAVKEVAVDRFDDALRALDEVTPTDKAARTAFEAKHKVRLFEDGGALAMEVASPDYSYVLRAIRPDNIAKLIEQLSSDDPGVVEEPVSERAKFDIETAEDQASELISGLLIPEERFNLPGLYAFRAKLPDAKDLPVHWVGPDTHISSQVPEDWARLTGLLRAGEQPIDARVFAELWVGFHQPIFSSVCTPQNNGQASLPVASVEDGVVEYRFWFRSRGQDCRAHRVPVSRSE